MILYIGFIFVLKDNFTWYLFIWFYEDWKIEILMMIFLLIGLGIKSINGWLSLLAYWGFIWLMDFYLLEDINDNIFYGYILIWFIIYYCLDCWELLFLLGLLIV